MPQHSVAVRRSRGALFPALAQSVELGGRFGRYWDADDLRHAFERLGHATLLLEQLRKTLDVVGTYAGARG